LAQAVGSTVLEGFETGRAELLPAHRAELQRRAHAIVTLLRQYPASTVLVIGHADTVGAKPNNMTLGTDRANAVRDALVALGVPAQAIVTQSVGEGPPQLVHTGDEVPNRHNRAVEIRFEPHRLSATLGAPLTLTPPPSFEDLTRPIDLRYHPRPEPFHPRPPAPPPYVPRRSGGPTIPAPDDSLESVLGGLIEHTAGRDRKDPHLGLDLASSVTANAPPGQSPTTYTVTLICRNCDLLSGDDAATVAVDLIHEPNVQIQISPDPQNAQVYQAAVTLVNLHLRRHRRELIEASLAAQAQIAQPTGTPSAGAQAQVELHVTTRFSLTASTSINVSPHSGSAPSDRGSIPIRTAPGGDWTWAPFSLGVLVHFD
jgi:hypothetical protein